MSSLTGALPETIAAYNALKAFAASQGITIGVADFGGLRTLADTNRILGYRQDDFNAAVKAGQIAPDTTLQHFRPISPFGSSYHNYGAAFDVAIIARPGSMTEYQAQLKLASYAPSIGLRWGGNFSPNADPPHFELAIPLAQAKARYTAMTGSAVPQNSTLDALTNSLKSLLPSLTPADTGAETYGPLDSPNYDDPNAYADADVSGSSTDDSGEVATVVDAAQTQNTDGLIIVGFFIAGALLWSIKRRYF